MRENSDKNKIHPNPLIEEWLEKMNQGAKKMANDENNQKKVDRKAHIPNDTTLRAIRGTYLIAAKSAIFKLR